MSVCDLKTAQKDTMLVILKSYLTNYDIVVTLGINWIETSNENKHWKN